MTFTADWLPKGVTLPAPAPYLEAVGALALWFNELEMSLYGFFQLYVEHRPARELLFAELHNRGRVDLLKTYLLEHPDDEFCDAARYGLLCFDICAENRNLIAHAFAEHDEEGGVAFLKRLGGQHGALGLFDFTLEEVRSAASSTIRTQHYLFDLYNWLVETAPRDDGFITRRPELPERPPQPRKLSLSRRKAAL